ncbi:MAG: apolipoprotein N-acyltransferase [Verrucomicrobia bacterium]|nr:MAG: apolipoprotein N-acyltransferase [Verrucomicrobiota bacterium]
MAAFPKALRLWPWLAAILSGLLCTACFAPFDQGWLCWVALTPLLAAIWFSGANSKRRWLRDLLLGYVAGLAFFWSVFSWLRTVTVPGLFLVGAYMSIYFALWSWVCGLLRPSLRAPVEVDRGTPPPPEEEALRARSPWLRSTNNLRLAFLLATVWVAQEWLRSVVFSGWGWNTLGAALHAQLVLIQIVEYTGVPGLSFLVAFTNVILLATIRRLILETRVRPIRPHYDFTLTMAAIIAVMSFGLRTLQTGQPSKPLRVALVQPNIPREQKFSPMFAQQTFDQFTGLSTPALSSSAPPDLIVWPESSMPGPVLQDELSFQFVMDFATSAKTDLLLGTLDLDETRDYNAALLVAESGQRAQIYRKIHLVPFGEYIPGRHTIPLLARVVGDQVPSDFAFGKDYTVFRLTNDKAFVAPLICFEDTIGDLARQFVLGGANLLANVTNDGWFLRSAGSQQHLANAVFRCIETRLPMVRAANTGVTCTITPLGQISSSHLLPPFTEGVLLGEVNLPTERVLTFYVRHGEIFTYGCVGVSILMFLFLGAQRLLRRRKSA